MALNQGDLIDLVDRVFEVDSYKSKMGSDADIVVLSFTVLEAAPARDLVDFIEKGYPFVLDADVSSGEQDDGMYRVFVEIERNDKVAEQVMELMDGVKKLTARDTYRFRYYKAFKSLPLTIENLTKEIPVNPDLYKDTVTESNMNNFKNFFNRGYLESVELDEDDELILKRAYADPINFKVKDFGPSTAINESIKEKINMNDYAEILFLTKYLGDYNVMKYGNKLITFENAGHTLVLERIT